MTAEMLPDDDVVCPRRGGRNLPATPLCGFCGSSLSSATVTSTRRSVPPGAILVIGMVLLVLVVVARLVVT